MEESNAKITSLSGLAMSMQQGSGTTPCYTRSCAKVISKAVQTQNAQTQVSPK